MSEIRIKHRARWGSVPESLIEDQRLSTDARLFAIWLTTKPDGWAIKIGVMLRRTGLTEGRWQAARRELIKAGYLISRRRQDDRGQIWWEQSFDPLPPPRLEPPRAAPAGVAAGATDIPPGDIPPGILGEMRRAASRAASPGAYLARLIGEYRAGRYVLPESAGAAAGAAQERRLADLKAERRLLDSRIRAGRDLKLEPQPADLEALANLDREIATAKM